MYEKLHQIALKAPQESGVYLWKNEKDTVIYVGKAKNLKNRLSSYFLAGRSLKTQLLVSHASQIEYITTKNEYEALLLENNLIKKYNPRYNISLKDGKSYPVLRITKESFPKVFKTRRVLQDGSTYYGPYPNVNALDTFIETIFQLYPLRRCRTLRKRESPCLYYHMKLCKAPCCGKITEEEYNQSIQEIIKLLEGKTHEALEKVKEEMKAAAKDLNFEKAARLRDGIKAFMILNNQNIVETFDIEDRDYISHYRDGELVSFVVLKIRQGKLIGKENYPAESLNEDEELLGEFMNAYYTKSQQLPPSIYVENNSQLEIISKWIDESFTDKSKDFTTKLVTAKTKRDQAALQMAYQNAKEDITRRMRDRGDTPAMEELKELLNLDSLPVRIEGFDIAHIGGKFPVASMISFYNGNPDKKNYRYFRLKTTDGIIDDFASMKEAVSRRYTRLLNEQGDLPDFILIDGGIGQVNAAEGVLASLKLDIPIAGLAEKNEEIYLPGCSKPIILPKRSDALRLLQRVRDETHRFATSQNQKLRTKEKVHNVFSEIEGVGPKRALLLQKNFISLENLSQAEENQISLLLKINSKQASKIKEEAIKLVEKENKIKAKEEMALQIPDTTREKSANQQYLENLANQALSISDED